MKGDSSDAAPGDAGPDRPTDEKAPADDSIEKSSGQPPSQDDVVAVPLPPMSPDQAPRIAMGVNLLMQRSSLDKLSPEIQTKLLDLADTFDKRGYEMARMGMEDGATSRKQTLLALGVAFLVIVISGGLVTNKLLEAGEIDKAFTFIMAAVGVVGALLGGAGLRSALKSFSGG